MEESYLSEVDSPKANLGSRFIQSNSELSEDGGGDDDDDDWSKIWKVLKIGWDWETSLNKKSAADNTPHAFSIVWVIVWSNCFANAKTHKGFESFFMDLYNSLK